ncbi:hypothetical protein PRUPE_1G466000 [Prunus persica]|uniref:Arf-GAP domain-containing protein n=1 Tax=Prunus persica TaxID=3760 RepID=A0A251RDN1_PRUPE|nr:hypothetical protein PRUPE_1G466000 [Prunus persica]
MGNRLKEDEKIERTIRTLLKHPQNKRCINCNCLGPQYVCTTFLTFVCTNCSGVHREFTHRVKSVSMAKFNAEEVSALQAGGNERARQIYFKEWDPQYHAYPDGSNLHRLRDFIKHVYVNRKYTGERSVYTGERSMNKLSRLRLSNEESDEGRKVGSYHGGSRSFHDDDMHERSYSQGMSPGERGTDRSLRYYYDERRSPRYSQENVRSGGVKRNPLRFEIVDNRIREEKTRRNGSSSGEFKVQSRATENKKNMERSRSLVARTTEEKLAQNVPPLQIGEISTENQKNADGSAPNQKIKSANGQDGNETENKIVSLIDFNTDSDPPHAAANSQSQQTPPPNNDNNWASFDSSSKEKASQVPNPDPLESLLLELSAPSSVPATNASETPRNDVAPSTLCISNMPAGGAAPAAPVEQMPTLLDALTASTSTSTSTAVPEQPANVGTLLALPPPSGGDTTLKVNNGQQPPSMQLSFTADSGSQHINTPVRASNGESRTLALAPNIQRSLSIPVEKSTQSSLKPAEDTGSRAGSEYFPAETRASMRKELPVDLFSARYSSVPAQASGWHTAPAPGMGYSMQYYPNTTVYNPAPAFPAPAKPTNPFDLNEEKSVVHSTHFPSMAPLQGALHHVSAPPGLMHASSLPTHFSQLKTPQSPTNESMMPSHSPSFATAFSPSAYMGQQLQNNYVRPQGVGGFGRGEAVFGALSTTQQPFQQPSIRYPAPSNSETFSSKRGNPFG